MDDTRSQSNTQLNVRVTEDVVKRVALLAERHGSTYQAVVAEAVELLWVSTTTVKRGVLNESELLSAELAVERYQAEPLPGYASQFLKEYGQRLIDSVRHWWRLVDNAGTSAQFPDPWRDSAG